MKLLRAVDDTKAAMCLSPQDKLKSVGGPHRPKRAPGASGAATETKRTRTDDDVGTTECELSVDGWISDDYLRAMELDDSLNQEIEWVAHDEMELTLRMDDALVQDPTTNADVQDFAFEMRGGLAFEDSGDMVSPFGTFLGLPMSIVDAAYLPLHAISTKDAEKLLMRFDTMNFKLPSPTSASRKHTRVFVEKESQEEVHEDRTTSTTATKDTHAVVPTSATAPSVVPDDEKTPGGSTMSPSTSLFLSVHAPVDAMLGLLPATPVTPSATLRDKKIGSYSPAARKLRLAKFHAKRKTRTWKKSIKYDCRKKLADDRPRIKGRFVRVLETANDAKTDEEARPCPAAAALAPCLAPLQPTPASVTTPPPLTAPSTTAAAVPLARMIASV
ncbi:hypothetical protein PsorP6_000705 [Peronosclerospora sorghi]|uniref:Uncharacterized protein n=1 Tax=Peronosclerospora sorghi TaxID=230839 RepID=A0ACC0WWF8_9STRA|nr:hypothetical protein PsorP6_000705 [Peronosclerospora sorghi]